MSCKPILIFSLLISMACEPLYKPLAQYKFHPHGLVEHKFTNPFLTFSLLRGSMATVEIRSATSALPTEAAKVQQELSEVAKDLHVEAAATEETSVEGPNEAAQATLAPTKVPVVEQAETPKEEVSGEVLKVHEAETPIKEDSNKVEVKEVETPKDEEQTEVVEEAEIAAEKAEVQVENATPDAAVEESKVISDEAVATGEDKEVTVEEEEEKNKEASNKETDVKNSE